MQGLEQHLVAIHDTVRAFRPRVVVIDPISNLTLGNLETEVKATLMRLIDFLKAQQITSIFTSLASDGSTTPEDSQPGVSSLMDTWLLLRNMEFNGERNRTIYVLKSRGMAHSNQVCEFVLSDHGIDFVDVSLGADHVLTGTAHRVREPHEHATAELRREKRARKLRRAEKQQR